MKKILIIILLIPILGISQNFTNKFKTDSLEYRIDSTNTLLSQFTFASCGGDNVLLVKLCEPLLTDTSINPTIREIKDSIARQNIILMNQTTPLPTLTTPNYSGNRTTFTINTIPAPYNIGVPANTREITIQNITSSDILIQTSQGTQILAARNNITLSNPLNTTINHAVFSGNVTISFYNSVGGNIFGVAPRVIIDFKTY